jgi:lipopolysaccharide export LptBFGC system permease protein LptF
MIWLFSAVKIIGGFIAGRAIAVFNMRMQIAAFIIDRWRIILPIAIVSIGLVYIIALRNDAKAARASLQTYIHANEQEKQKREADIKLNTILAQKKTDAEVDKWKTELNNVLAKGKHNEKLSLARINALRSELRKSVEASVRLSENDTSPTASGNSDTTLLGQVEQARRNLDTCEMAGAVCASDYNLCKRYVDVQQSIIGVSK